LCSKKQKYILELKEKGNNMTDTTIKRMFQIGIVVSDAIAAAENFCELFQVDKDIIMIIDTRDNSGDTVCYCGKKIMSQYLLAMVCVANVEFEFIQHVGGDAGYHKDYFDKHGAAIDHICVDVGSYQDTVDKMVSMGGEVISAGGQEKFDYKYIDMRESMGIVFELYNDMLRDMKMNS